MMSFFWSITHNSTFVLLKLCLFLFQKNREVHCKMDEDQKKCGGISLVGIIAILVSLACIIIGAINIDFDQTEFTDQDIISTCKAQTKIPFYLVVAGVLNIMLMVLRLIFQVRFFPISNWIIMTFLKCLIVSIETKWCHCFYWNKISTLFENDDFCTKNQIWQNFTRWHNWIFSPKLEDISS